MALAPVLNSPIPLALAEYQSAIDAFPGEKYLHRNPSLPQAVLPYLLPVNAN